MKIGQKLYFKPTMNEARRNPDRIIEATIIKIGRKYFYVDSEDYSVKQSRFHLDTLAQDGMGYCSNWQGYNSVQEIEDKKEIELLKRKIQKKFAGFGNFDLSLDVLRKIADLANCA